MSASRIYSSYRGLGLVSNGLPLEVRYIKRRREHLIVTVVGSAFHTYGSNKLGLLSVSNPLKNPINCLASNACYIFTASGTSIFAWRRGAELKHTYLGFKGTICLMLCFGAHLIAVNSKNEMKLWNIDTEELSLQMEFPANFRISSVVHPATYVNKILFGSTQGKLQLLNLKTNELIYTYEGWGSEITVLEQAPAQDVVAIGMADGRIILHNLKFDETLMEFKQNWGKVTAISFRTDNIPIMVSGSEMGHLAFWDLNEKKLSSQHMTAHSENVSGMRCLPNEPLMITNSSDNTLKMWIFDLPGGGARLLRLKEGHSQPPRIIRFHGSQGNQIISGGDDSTVRVFSTVTDLLNKNLGKASYNRKRVKKKGLIYDKRVMPPIISLTSETIQEKSWDNIVSIHKDSSMVITWSIKNQKMGEHKLIHDRFKNKNMLNTVAMCIELTVCGNFAIIGYDSGHVDKYNIQSGLHRGNYGNPVAHEDSVRAVVSDGTNYSVISGGDDKCLKWWVLKDCRFISKLDMSECIAKMMLHRDSGLLAVATDDWSVYIVDVEVRTIVRKFVAHADQITDIGFSPDSRWLISASMDHTIMTWDIPSGTCVDAFKVPVPVSSLTFSPIGDFLATIHSGHLGVFLWSNGSCFQHLSLNPLPEGYEPRLAKLPSMGIDFSVTDISEDDMEPIDIDKIESNFEYKSPEQVSEELVTLALLPTSRWLNLLNIDIIKKRNKPTQPPKVTKAAPFFIPTVPGLDFKFAATTLELAEIGSEKKSQDPFTFLTPFGILLQEKKYEQALHSLMKMGPSAIDVEIKGLDPDTGGSEEVVLRFLKMIECTLKKHKNVEVAEGYLSLFLKHHSEFIMKNTEAQETCQKLFNVHHSAWQDLRRNFSESLCLLSYLKNAALINY